MIFFETFLALALSGAPVAAKQPAALPACATERQALTAERSALRTAVSDIATGRWHKQNKKKRKMSGGDAAKAAGSAAASVLLPFPLGLAVSAASSAGSKKGAAAEGELAPGVARPDVPALIERQQAVEARLAELGAC